MLLITDNDLEEMQTVALNDFYLDFLDKLETGHLMDLDYQQPRTFIFELFKAVLIGKQEYVRLYSLVEDVMLNRKHLFFFNKVHTRQEILDFISSIY